MTHFKASLFAATAIVLALGLAPALGQGKDGASGGGSGAQAQTQAEVSGRHAEEEAVTPSEAAEAGILTVQQRKRIRDAFAQRDVDPFTLGETVRPDDTAVSERQVAIGKRFPRALPVRRLPERLRAEMPKIEGHEYRLFGDDLAVVKSDTGTVVDIMREVYVRER